MNKTIASRLRGHQSPFWSIGFVSTILKICLVRCIARQEEIASSMWYLGDVTSNYDLEIVPNENKITKAIASMGCFSIVSAQSDAFCTPEKILYHY